MKVSDERLADFNGRMNDWISKQGLLFQLTHGGTGLGGRPPIIGAFIRAVSSLLLLLFVAVLAYGGFLVWKATGDELPKNLETGISQSIQAEEITTEEFQRDLASGSYKQIIALGGDSSFYNTLEARDISFPMDPLDGLFGTWDAKVLNFGELKIALKAGEANDERAQNSWQSLFEERPSFSFTKIEVAQTSLSWGYNSPATWGSIIDSQLIADRTDAGWSLEFKGGTFSQGLFRDCQIEELKVELNKEEGFSIPSARFLIGEGSFDWSARMVSGGASPAFKVEGTLFGASLDNFLPRGLLTAVNGNFSGSLTADGSTNDSEGIRFQISGKPEGEEGIYLTKEFPVLRMLSHLDPTRSYRKVAFNQGSFQLNTVGNELTFSDVDLRSKESESSQIVAILKGDFQTRPASPEDLANETLALDELAQSVSETIGVTTENQEASQADFSNEILKQFPHLQFKNPHQELFYFTKDNEGEDLIKNRLDLTPRSQHRLPHLMEGNVKLAVPASAFSNSVQLPMVTTTEDWPSLKWIEVDLNSLILRSSKKLSTQWEEALEEALEEGL